MFAVQFSADWFSSWRAVWKSSPFVQYGGPSIVETRRQTQKPLGYRFLRRVANKNNRCEFWYLFLFYFYLFFYECVLLSSESLSVARLSTWTRFHTTYSARTRRQSARAHCARPSRSPFMFFCFFFSEMNSFFGLLSSQLPCSRCSCRRCLLPPRRDTQEGGEDEGARGGEKIK